MNNSITMTAEFDRQKKIQAAAYTGVIATALLLIIWLVRFYEPVIPPPPVEEYIEIALPDIPPVEDVNLGNNDVGSGNVQPIVTGSPSSAPVSQDIAQSKGANSQQATRDFDEDDRPNSPAITKPVTPNPTSKEINNNAADQSVTAKPQLKRGAQMTSTTGSGSGGNTTLPGYNKPGEHGPGDGKGDKGTFNGNPKATNFGTKKANPIFNKDFKGDFNQNAVVFVLVEVNANGKVTKANYTSKGSSGTATGEMKREAERRAFEVDFSKGAPQKGTIQFDFRVQ